MYVCNKDRNLKGLNKKRKRKSLAPHPSHAHKSFYEQNKKKFAFKYGFLIE